MSTPTKEEEETAEAASAVAVEAAVAASSSLQPLPKEQSSESTFSPSTSSSSSSSTTTSSSGAKVDDSRNKNDTEDVFASNVDCVVAGIDEEEEEVEVDRQGQGGNNCNECDNTNNKNDDDNSAIDVIGHTGHTQQHEQDQEQQDLQQQQPQHNHPTKASSIMDDPNSKNSGSSGSRNDDAKNDDHSSSSSSSSSYYVRLQFDDFIDLQTRCVLMPWSDDDEGTGAIIMAYHEKNENDVDVDVDSIRQQQQQQDPSLSTSHNRNVEGLILWGVEKSVPLQHQQHHGNVDNGGYPTMDFTTIWMTLRTLNPPITLLLGPPPSSTSPSTMMSDWAETTVTHVVGTASLADKALMSLSGSSSDDNDNDDDDEENESDEESDGIGDSVAKIATTTLSSSSAATTKAIAIGEGSSLYEEKKDDGNGIRETDNRTSSPRLSPQRPYYDKQQQQSSSGSASPSHNRSPRMINSVLDDTVDPYSSSSSSNNNSSNTTTTTTATPLLSTMSALSTWGFRVRAQSERLAADAAAIAASKNGVGIGSLLLSQYSNNSSTNPSSSVSTTVSSSTTNPNTTNATTTTTTSRTAIGSAYSPIRRGMGRSLLWPASLDGNESTSNTTTTNTTDHNKNNNSTSQTPPTPTTSSSSLSKPNWCDMYVQSSLGAFFPVSDINVPSTSTNAISSSSSSMLQVTTSSLLVIRKSATEPLLPTTTTTTSMTSTTMITTSNSTTTTAATSAVASSSNKQQQHHHQVPDGCYFTFQWYRSTTNNTQTRERNELLLYPASLLYDSNIQDEEEEKDSEQDQNVTRTGNNVMNSASDGTSSPSSSTSSVDDVPKETEEEWIPLKGATNATFQPNTTLVGRRLRCVVTVFRKRRKQRRNLDNDNDDIDDGHDDNHCDGTTKTTTAGVVSHTSSLLAVSSSSSSSSAYTTSSSYSSSNTSSSPCSSSTSGPPLDKCPTRQTDDHYGGDDDDDDVEDYNDDDGSGSNNGNLNNGIVVDRIICELPDAVRAELTMFNGARQAMIRGGAKFGNLLGRTATNDDDDDDGSCINSNNAATTFRIEVGIGRKTIPDHIKLKLHEKEREIAFNSVQICCRHGSEQDYEPLTDRPILQVSAQADPSNSKYVDLIFPTLPPLTSTPATTTSEECGVVGQNSSTSLSPPTKEWALLNYCVIDPSGRSPPRLELEVPNRMTRESLLLALGIANYRGKPGLLNNQTVLFRDDEVSSRPLPSPVTTTVREAATLNPTTTTPMPSTDPEDATKPPVGRNVDNVGTDGPLKDFGPNENNLDESISTTNGDTDGRDAVSCNSPPRSPDRPNRLEGSGDPVQATPGNSDTSFFSCLSTPDNTNIIDTQREQQQKQHQHRQQNLHEEPIQRPNHCKATEVGTDIGGNVKVRPASAVDKPDANASLRELQRELDFLRGTLVRKDRVVAELQRQVTKSDEAHQKTKQKLASYENELKQSRQDCERIQMAKRQVERTLQVQYDNAQRIEANHRQAVRAMEVQSTKQLEKIADLEKANRTLQNEKAVLGATVEARESKLERLGDLQASNDRLLEQVRGMQALHVEINESKTRYQRLEEQLAEKVQSEDKCRKELQDALDATERSKGRIQVEQQKAASCHAQLEVIQKSNQQLKGERNSYKQKNESLSKEISRLCRNGRSVRDIERILADHEALLHEAETLRVQKRKALEEVHMYRTSYERTRVVDQLGGVEQDTRRALERTAELERLLAEMTDYVQAKEMQMETMKLVNETLQEEIRNLAQANFRKNEV